MAMYFKTTSEAHKSIERLFHAMEQEGVAMESVSGNVRFYVNDNKGNSVMVRVIDADTEEEVLTYPPEYEWRLKVVEY